MPMFRVEYAYSPETSSGRDDHRTDHRAWLRELERRKILRSSGPWADHSGATMIVESADKESVQRMFAHDPFALAHLIDSVRIDEWVAGT
ncbi:MAG: YciI family protein [Rhodococcus sp. (in: high G+C Gram-positive bacteria)]